MQKRWSLRWMVLLFLGHFFVHLCQGQEPTADDKDEELSDVKLESYINEFEGNFLVVEDQKVDDKKLSFDSNHSEDYLDFLAALLGDHQTQCSNTGELDTFLEIVLGHHKHYEPFKDTMCRPHEVKSNTTDELSQVKQDYQRPVCTKGEGCDIPLNCYDFVTNGPHEIVPDPPRAVELTPLELQNLLGNGTYKNCCALVMFYAPWCEYSVNFAQRFNAIGRTFLNLPVIAVDLSAHDPHKFVLAYLPVIAFYHWGKVIYKFDLEDTYEDMVDQLAKMTDFEPVAVNIEDEENFRPVPIEREKADRFYLRLAVGWLIFVLVVTVLKSKPVMDFMYYLRSRFNGPPPQLVAEENEQPDQH